MKAHWQLNSTTPSAKEANPAPAPARIDESCLMGLQLVIESPRLSSTPPASACPPSCECNMTRVLMCFLPSLCRSSLFYHGAPRLRNMCMCMYGGGGGRRGRTTYSGTSWGALSTDAGSWQIADRYTVASPAAHRTAVGDFRVRFVVELYARDQHPPISQKCELGSKIEMANASPCWRVRTTPSV